VLTTVAQAIWVVDRDGVIRFANPAAIAALGYDSEDELLGRHSHATIHHHRPDGTPYPAEECPMLLPRVTGETVAVELDWFFRRDDSMFPVSYVSVPLDLRTGRGAVVAFTDIEDRLLAQRALSERDDMLVAEQTSLQRVAALVARGAASAEVFAAVAREVSQVIALPMVAIWRYEFDGTATVIGEWSERPTSFRVGTRWPIGGPTVVAMVLESGRPERIEDFGPIPGTIAGAAREAGIGSCVGAPILVEGRLWGVMSADKFDREPLAEGIELKLAQFTDLVATAISNSESREALVRLAEEQTALRRVATLVAEAVPPGDVFAAVAREVGMLIGAETAQVGRFGDDGTVTVVAGWGSGGERVVVGTTMPTDGENVCSMVIRTGRPARMDGFDGAPGPIAALLRQIGIRSSAGAPIVVDGRQWGITIASTRGEDPLPADTEGRIAAFTDLAATAISNAQARSDLAASRARIVAAADEERRRVVRDLHDGAQQRLVNTIVTLKLADEALQADRDDTPELLEEALEHAEQAISQLRELSHGILPTALTRGGLRAAIEALTSRATLPIALDVPAERLPAAVEATAYFVIAEALTNVVKHANATRASVRAWLDDGTLAIEVRDDGIGGARPEGGGLVGVADRLAALDGRLRVDSPRDGGTLLAAEIPLPRE
jgi:PAS domain S-box-containing protein